MLPLGRGSHRQGGEVGDLLVGRGAACPDVPAAAAVGPRYTLLSLVLQWLETSNHTSVWFPLGVCFF